VARKVRTSSQPQAGTAPTSVSTVVGETAPAAPQPEMIFPAQLPQQPAMNLPPTFHAGQLIISASVGEISVTFGHTRMSPTVQNGVNTAIPFVEWYSTITLSAPVAQQLADGLKQALEQYTALFGKIPKQPPVPPPAKKQ
jgi:hypothetical protein